MADPLLTRISGTDHKVDQLKEALERIENHREGNQNVTTIRFDGEKSVKTSLLVGFVGGAALGVAVMAAGWVAWALSDVKETQRDQQAFIDVTYQHVPLIRAEFDKIKAKQAQEEKKQ